MKEGERIVTEKQTVGECHKCVRYFSWTGVIAGALVATGLSFLLNLFNLGIGLAVVNNTKEGVMTVAIGGLIGMMIGSFATLFTAGWVSGFIARSCNWHRHLGVLQGLTTWCLALLIMATLFASNVSFVSLGSHLLATNLSSSTTVHVTADENTPAIRQAETDRSQITVNAEKVANNVGKAALITFLLFFVGAVASCLGGFIAVCDKDYLCRKL